MAQYKQQILPLLTNNVKTSSNTRFNTLVDIFSGAGGFSLGFQMAGFKIIGALEVDKWASETFKQNHPESKVIIDDIRNVSNENLKTAFDNPDIVLGGPPCQGFSICVKNSCDPKDPRNSLFIEFLRIIRVLNPRVVIMENVPNLLNARINSGERVIDIIHIELNKLGYEVQSDVLEAVRYGIPQIRKRLFVIGSKVSFRQFFPEPTHDEIEYVSLWDAISDLPDIEAREGAEIMDYDRLPQNDYQIEMRKDCKNLYNHIAMNHSKRMIERFRNMRWGDSARDVPKELMPYKRGEVGNISENAYDQNNRRMYPYKPCHTIPSSFYANFVHPFKHRNFTAREGARIQTFPDKYKFCGKPTVVSHKLLEREGRIDEKYLCQYNQIGNAVPPILAKAIAENLKNQLENY